MRVLYIHQYFATPDSATGTRSYEFARRLVRRQIAARSRMAPALSGIASREDSEENMKKLIVTTLLAGKPVHDTGLFA